MPGIDPVTGTFALPLWAAAAAAALFVVVGVRAFNRPGTGTLGPLVSSAGVVLTAIVVAWMIAGRPPPPDSQADRRALEARAAALVARAIEVGSPLACLDGIAGETVEAACEKAIFAEPETVAAAISYVSARLGLLADMAEHGKTHDGDLDGPLAVLRKSLEADRFGFVAHVLVMRDGCTSQACNTLSLLRDAGRVRTNLSAHLLDRYLNHYALEWAKAPAAPAPVADASAPAKPKMVNIDFPTAASIPPVSIMNPEPTGPVLPGVAAAAAANPNPPAAAAPTSPRRARRQAAEPPPAAASPQPAAAQSAPPPRPSPAPPAAAATTGPPVVPPVQLVPFPTPEANAGLTTRAQ
jgi:hypothetical protein